jgi:hypothetical protein
MTPPLAPAVDTHARPAAEAPIGAKAADDLTSRAESLNALAALLLDWRVDCERHLRGLTSMQRWLERVRCGAADAGERDLLLQEVGRLLRETPPGNADWIRQAEGHLSSVTR